MCQRLLRLHHCRNRRHRYHPLQPGALAVWLEGWIFFILSLFGIRQWLARLLPHSIKLSTGAGIGIFLAFIGLGPNGLGVIGGNASDLIGLAGCPAQYEDSNGFCQSHKLQAPPCGSA